MSGGSTKTQVKAANGGLERGMVALRNVGARRMQTFGGLLAVLVVFSVWAVIDGGSKLLLQRTFDGLNNGFIYSAMALSLVLIYRSTGIINFAQGNMAMFGTFIAYVLIVEQGLSVVAGVIVAMVISAIGAAVIERLFVWPFDPKNHLAITIVTLSWYLIIAALAGIIWAFDPRAFPSPFPTGANDYVSIGGARIRYASLGIWATVLLTLVLVTQLLRRTKIGLAFRAVSSNLDSGRLVGIRIGRVVQLGWALSAAVGTLAGCLIAPSLLLDPNFMSKVLIYSFAAATLGGLDSLGGAVIGGLIIGLVQTMSGGYFKIIGSEFSLASALAVIIVILLVKPSGLFGSRRVERV
ncbi:MAG: putative branched-chain amino acid transporter ATP-binding protein [Ilumatobacteraceae bacterium]|nr:putative branched-chain amino acid transporter ATP-binding protein [Ilumatobacteraceae bacterium]